MPATAPVKALFLDIGGVLLSNGWDRQMRQQAVEFFGLDAEETNDRHHLTFDTYEAGKLTLDEYLQRTVFYQPRSFAPDDVKRFMLEQSKPIPEMIDLVRRLKQAHHLRVAAVSNEGRELTLHRIGTFGMATFIDFFICSCFVHLRKPDAEIYRMALDVAQVGPGESVYIDDRAMFVEVGQGLGFRGIHHRSFEETRAALAEFGLTGHNG
jgi:putative hydrolase of the HAD superfamily